MPLMADVESDQQRGDLLHDACILEFAAIERAHRNLCRQFADRLGRILVVAAHDHVTFDRAVAVHHIGRAILKCGDHGHAFGNEFCGLLRGRSLPHSESSAGAATHASGQRYRGVDQDAVPV